MKTIIYTDKAPAPIGPYNQAVLVDNTLYTSGQIALNPATMELVLDTIEIETTQVMENMKAVLDAANMTFADVPYGRLMANQTLISLSDINKKGVIKSTTGIIFFRWLK